MSLDDYCNTDLQKAILQDHAAGMTGAAIARKYAVSERSVRRIIKNVLSRAGDAGYDYSTDLQLPVPQNQINKGTSYRFDVIDGKAVVRGGWVLGRKPNDTDVQELITSIIEGTNKKHVATKVAKPKVATAGLVNYIVGDHHHGMLAWVREVLHNWDCDISETYFKRAITYLMSQMPDTDTAGLVILGDFFHAENFEGVTHKSKNPLDTDGRFTNMYETGADMLRWAIDVLRTKHKHVHFFYAPGNHDTIPARTLRHALEWRYEGIPDVTIHDNARYFIPFTYHNNFFLFHHGDRTKMDKTYDVAVRDHITELSRTKHHYGYTGHIHQSKLVDRGMKIESFRILAPQDQYAHDGGWSMTREMQARYYHPEHGQRLTAFTDGEDE